MYFSLKLLSKMATTLSNDQQGIAPVQTSQQRVGSAGGTSVPSGLTDSWAPHTRAPRKPAQTGDYREGEALILNCTSEGRAPPVTRPLVLAGSGTVGTAGGAGAEPLPPGGPAR